MYKFKNKSHGSNLSEEEESKLAMSRAFPSFDGEFKDIMSPEDLNDVGDRTQVEDGSSERLSASDAELFMANLENFSEIRRIHEEIFRRLPSGLDLSYCVKDSLLSSPVDSLYSEAFEWGYQTAALVKAITPCKLFLASTQLLTEDGF